MERVLFPEIERLSRPELENLQWQKFKGRLAEWYHQNPFYRDHLRRSAVTPDDIRSPADLKRLPITTKQDYLADQQAAPPYGRRLGVPPSEIARIIMTSGTSGSGKELHPHTLADIQVVARLSALCYRWAGLERGDIMAFNVGITNNAGGWCFLGGGMELGRVPYMLAHESFPARLELMRTFGVNGLYGTPSTLNGLTSTCLKQGKHPRELFPDLRFLLTSAEAFPIEFALRMQDEWGVPLHEDYGSSQTQGAIAATTCENGAVVHGQRGFQHLIESSFLFELVDPETGEDARPGEPAELIVTTLDKQASPVLRFRTRDKMIWYPHSRCNCGRPFSLIEAGTIARWDDMLKVKGVNIWPAAADEVVFSFKNVEEYQGEVYISEQGRDEARIALAFGEPGGARSEAEREQELVEIAQALRSRLGIRIQVQEVPLQKLPTFATPDKKARRWTDLRKVGLKEGLPQ